MGIQDRDYWRERYKQQLNDEKPAAPKWSMPKRKVRYETPQQREHRQAWNRIFGGFALIVLAGAAVVFLARVFLRS